ncbi:PLP-dependent aminotransferase family protein [Sphingobacterium athyrii]|uniref:PLP-dependent aminotransferase family protein n=2 Tax=Sphingobacteriaceae TaxID=84566 RepID=A0A363NLD9_9SPHI|nr:PLP-dependent aminotransferase family protein [Sphingobacterium athyrii]PUV21628.1 PLP-dependent aminotransferase family protein [Sphingobacterium athyrii]QIH35822.1 PLP-dependent aminotransferase family protein [Sphingobacterium sp. DR205]
MLRPWNLTMEIDRSSTKAIYLQLADSIAADIQSGRLTRGTALPSSRALAAQLKLNRNTVVEAFQQLLSEGWVVSEQRRGIFVAQQLPQLIATTEYTAHSIIEPQTSVPLRIIFDDGNPDSKIAPIDQLGRAYRQIFKRSARWKMMGYADPRGHIDFRQAIADMLNQERNMNITLDNLCISRGSQMAMYLVAQCLLKKDDFIFVESPGYHSAWKIFEHTGAQLIEIPVDQDGILVDEMIPHLKENKNIKAAYLTPHRQYPTTATLSQARRSELIQLSNRYGFTLIEDDYDYEFHFDHTPCYPLAADTELQNSIYIGTLSKVVAPALRIGYLVSKDEQLLQAIAQLRYMVDIQGDNIMEQAVLELIQDGTVRRHIRKATNYYKNKRDFMVKQLDLHLLEHISYQAPQGGLAVWLEFRHQINWTLLFKKLKEKSVHIPHPDNYHKDNCYGGLRLGYGSLSEEQIEDGIRILADLLQLARIST